MSETARGTFVVDTSQRPQDPDTEGLAQLQLRKTWTGDLEGTGWGLMVSGGDPEAGCAGYVAMEMVAGMLGGSSGRFALQQFGTMQDGAVHQVYEIVPGSGTDALSGLSGTLAMSIEDGAHVYSLTYDLPAAAG